MGVDPFGYPSNWKTSDPTLSIVNKMPSNLVCFSEQIKDISKQYGYRVQLFDNE